EALSIMPDENMVDMKINTETATIVCGKVRRNIRLDVAQDIVTKSISNLQLACTLEVNTAEMSKITSKINGSKLFNSDTIIFVVGPEGLLMTIDDENHTDSVEYRDETLVSQDGETHKASYDLGYITDAFSSLPQNIRLSMQTDYPVKIEADAPFKIAYTLAPRIDEE
ncbi:MAG: hypothetical protein IJV47_06245, partial [Candidatus Methanomethylophilaceae archaeon]|nr:hypothetical protein [Candidatus Methanomethylophilaceae archaeon]MBQ9690189.1 hypothetical protein [Candidatus Methanomethylophilaceae archaeon]